MWDEHAPAMHSRAVVGAGSEWAAAWQFCPWHRSVMVI